MDKIAETIYSYRGTDRFTAVLENNKKLKHVV
jgi:hypothetical protein